tara:strand:- start:175 stop:1461 length:1287 start_codon:yes stop_codon:yes gene_type:complete
MGFLSKIFKGVKKVFKKIGKGIKKVAGKVGKFMGKIGIVGQIALSFLLPGIGAFLGKAAMGMMGSTNALISGAGKFLNVAVKIGQKAGSLVKSVGEGVTKVIGKTIGATLNAVPGGKAFTGFLKNVTNGKLDFVGDTFLGKDGSLLGDGGVLGTARDSVLNIKSAGVDLFSKSTVDSSLNKFAVEANIKNQLADSRFRDVVDPDLKVSSAEFQSNLEKGLSPMEAIQPQAVDLSKTPTLDISDPAKFYNTTNTEVGIIPGEYTAQIPAGLEPVTTGGSDTYAFDDKGFSNSLLAPPPTLTPEQIAEGYTYDAGATMGVAPPKRSLGTKIAESAPIKKAQAKAASKLTASNVLRATAETLGAAGQTANGEAGYAFDVPNADQQDVGSGGADQLAEINTDTRTTVQGYEALYQQGQGPQSTWGKTLAGLV